MPELRIRNWRAQRSGPTMTVHGDDDRQPSRRVKLAGIKLIEPSREVPGAMQAVMADGTRHELLVA